MTQHSAPVSWRWVALGYLLGCLVPLSAHSALSAPVSWCWNTFKISPLVELELKSEEEVLKKVSSVEDLAGRAREADLLGLPGGACTLQGKDIRGVQKDCLEGKSHVEEKLLNEVQGPSLSPPAESSGDQEDPTEWP